MDKEGVVEMTLLVRPRLGEWKNRSDDRIWKAWVNTFKPDAKSLHALLEDPSVRDGFKARVLMVLLALKEDATGVFWTWSPTQSPRSPLKWTPAPLRNLSASLRPFAIDLLMYAHDKSKENVGPEQEDLRTPINRYILSLLGHATGEQVVRLWDKYNINDPEPFWGIDESSGYTPWLRLMMDPEISAVLNMRADFEMRRIILDEESNRTAPRAPWEQAVVCYIRHISMMLMSEPDKFPYSIELLRQQILFIGKVVGNEKRYVPSYTTRRLLKLFDSLHYGYRNVIENAINNKEEPFAIYDAAGLDLARHMQRHLGQEDPLWEKLEDMINDALPEILARRNAKADAEMKRETVLSWMRIPESV